ncbi:SDR family oxidoreductase [Companilactobacillus alimentarius]
MDKVVVIMGASSGIGAATAKLLASKGAKVTIAARRMNRLEEIKKDNPDSDILAVEADVTKEKEVQNVIDKTIEKFGRVDVLFNNAGIMPVNNLDQIARDEWTNMLDINIKGVLNGIAAALPIMEGLRQEEHKNNIKTTIIAPGSVKTELYKSVNNSEVHAGLEKVMEASGTQMEALQPEEIAQAVAFVIDTPSNMAVNEMVIRPTG